MLTRIALAISLLMFLVAPAMADATSTAKAVSDAFQKSCSKGNVSDVMNLYEDDATVIWPGPDEFAKGKDAIKKVVANFCKPSTAGLKLESQDSKQLGKDYIINVGRWETTSTGPNGKPMKVEVRTTELLHRSGGVWRYAVDHASIGVPPPPASGAGASH